MQTKSIHERAKDILTRDTISHRECDRIVGKRNEPHKNLMLIDRALRYVRPGWVPDGTAAAVACHRAGRQHDGTGISNLELHHRSRLRVLGLASAPAGLFVSLRSRKTDPEGQGWVHE